MMLLTFLDGDYDVNDAPDQFSLGWGDWAHEEDRWRINETRARFSRGADLWGLALYELGVLVAGGTLDDIELPKPEYRALPLPGERFFNRIVIASVWGRDGFSDSEREDALWKGEPEFLATLLMLNSAAPYYTVAQIKSQDGLFDPWSITASEDFPNINPAVIDGYAQWGGDY